MFSVIGKLLFVGGNAAALTRLRGAAAHAGLWREVPLLSALAKRSKGRTRERMPSQPTSTSAPTRSSAPSAPAKHALTRPLASVEKDDRRLPTSRFSDGTLD